MTCHYCKSLAKKFGKYESKKIQRYRCLQCGKTFSDEQAKPLYNMRIPFEKAVQIVNLLVEGVGINATSRLSGMDKETVLKVLVLAGQRCEKLLDSRIRDLRVSDVQCDEIWSFVKCKQRNIRVTDNPNVVGDQFTYVAMDPETKLVIAFAIGKRNIPVTEQFISDMSERITSHVQISTDAWGAYKHAIRRAFGWDATHGVIRKIYSGNGQGGDGRYSPRAVIGAIRVAVSGAPIPEKICTSHVERGNLSMRTFLRRMTRLCLGFSKKLENLKYAVALYFAWYNFCRVHSTIRTTPAMAAGITSEVWTLDRLLV